MVRTFLRDLAVPMTWLLLHTPISANQVTIAATIVGMIACSIIAIPGTSYFFSACLLLQFWYYLDHVDGQIARYRKQSSLSGRFFDFIMHHLIHHMLILGISLYAYQIEGTIFSLCLGMMMSVLISIFNLSYDAEAKTFLEKLLSDSSEKPLKINPQNLADQKEASHSNHSKNKFKFLYSLIHKSCEIHVMMNLLTLFSILELFKIGDFSWRLLTWKIYLVLIPILTLTKLYHVIQNKKIDERFNHYFQQ